MTTVTIRTNHEAHEILPQHWYEEGITVIFEPQEYIYVLDTFCPQCHHVEKYGINKISVCSYCDHNLLWHCDTVDEVIIRGDCKKRYKTYITAQLAREWDIDRVSCE